MSRIVIGILLYHHYKPIDLTCLFTYLTMNSQMCLLIISDELGIAWKNVSMTCALSTPFG
jgi:hypothetical protein